MSKLDLIFTQLNREDCKSYLYSMEGVGEACIVDPIIQNVDDYLKILENHKLKLTHVIDTHCHADHISGCTLLREKTGCEYVMSEASKVKTVTIKVSDGQELMIAGTPTRFILTPGHTMDSMSIMLPGPLLTGDTLFLDEGGAGRTDLPGGNPSSHYESLQKLRDLEKSMVVCPGHDYRRNLPGHLKDQLNTNPFFKYETKDDYLEFVGNLKLGPADWMVEVLKANIEGTTDPNAAYIPQDEAPACEVMGTAPQTPSDDSIKYISAEELKAHLDSDRDDIILLDIREPAELYEQLGALDNILHLPMGQVATNLDYIDEDKEVVIVCRSGHRAVATANQLIKSDFPRVTILKGGMVEWRQKFAMKNS